MTIFARVDHAAGERRRRNDDAANGGSGVRRAQGGHALLLAAPTIGIDLPLRALVWRDKAGTVWLAYNQPAWIAQRHGVAGQPVVEAMTDGLARLAERGRRLGESISKADALGRPPSLCGRSSSCARCGKPCRRRPARRAEAARPGRSRPGSRLVSGLGRTCRPCARVLCASATSNGQCLSPASFPAPARSYRRASGFRRSKPRPSRRRSGRESRISA